MTLHSYSFVHIFYNLRFDKLLIKNMYVCIYVSCMSPEYEQRTSYGALVVTIYLAMLSRLNINCCSYYYCYHRVCLLTRLVWSKQRVIIG